MAENEAPTKIYLERILCSNEVYDNWKSQKTFSDDIEYTRTDAFIEKVAKWLDGNAARFGTESTMEIEYFVDTFKKEIRSYVYGKI